MRGYLCERVTKKLNLIKGLEGDRESSHSDQFPLYILPDLF